MKVMFNNSIIVFVRHQSCVYGECIVQLPNNHIYRAAHVSISHITNCVDICWQTETRLISERFSLIDNPEIRTVFDPDRGFDLDELTDLLC
ncbi:MAG: hypothetical protein D6712_03675 [Chloroflexi bacterium]|nr:MAG: hypothetical protein D6712_03675 [Chloroflexota bacterium]